MGRFGLGTVSTSVTTHTGQLTGSTNTRHQLYLSHTLTHQHTFIIDYISLLNHLSTCQLEHMTWMLTHNNALSSYINPSTYGTKAHESFPPFSPFLLLLICTTVSSRVCFHKETPFLFCFVQISVQMLDYCWTAFCRPFTNTDNK